jgi:cytochrome c oxidase subunit 2
MAQGGLAAVNSMRLLPESASSFAGEYNLLFWMLVAICGTVATGIAIFIVYCALRYRRRRENELPVQIHGDIRLEATWTLIPLLLFCGMFAWGAKLYFDIERPPINAIDISVTGKQWMWKLQHPDGAREINELHVPVNRDVKLTMTSQDVIHSFYVPAFRIKQDVLPGRYTEIWFRATKPGEYHLFCAEYCGAKHSGMIGYVHAMQPDDYRRWVEQGGAEGSLASQGEKLFHQFGCANCHHLNDQGQCPNLRNLYGTEARLATGEMVTADAGYIRESIVNPRAKVVAGFEPIMPTFEGQLTEDQIFALIAYVRALGPAAGEGKGIVGPGSTSISGSVPEKR